MSPHLSQHVVPPQNRPGTEGLPALGAAVFALLVLSIPAMLDAAFAVAVAAVNGDRFFQKIQTHRTGKLIPVQLNFVLLTMLKLLLAGHFSENAI